jgi:gas vesicle protein
MAVFEIIQGVVQGRPQLVVIKAVRLFNKLERLAIEQPIVIDATVTEDHKNRARLTKHPIETGTAITDHMFLEPVKLTIDGVISDTPITFLAFGSSLAAAGAIAATQKLGSSIGGFKQVGGALGGVVTGSVAGLLGFSQISNRSVTNYQSLLELLDKKQPVRVTTRLRVFENMMLVNLNIPRDQDTGRSLRFTATFEQIQTATSESFSVSETVINSSASDAATKNMKTGAKTVTDVLGNLKNGIKDVNSNESLASKGATALLGGGS